MFRIICILIGYCLGCIQTAYFVSRAMKKDIRKYGSGNLGTTNAMRVLGKKAGIVTFLCDVLKCIVAFYICYTIYKSNVAGIYASFGVMLGHDFPFYLKFKGGKGIASSLGMNACIFAFISPVAAIISTIMGAVGLKIKGYVSMGSLSLIITIPIMCFICGVNYEITLITFIMAVIAVFKHKSNIIRIINGNENTVFKK